MAGRLFEPIAIIGEGCVLPGCFTPNALWQAVCDGRDLMSAPPPGRWGMTAEEETRQGGRGGFVTGFERRFEADAFDLGDVDPRTLDPVCQWLLQAGLDAWRNAGRPDAAPERIAVIAGNLSYPSRALSDFAADVWMKGASDIAPINRYTSGFPAMALARALGAAGTRFCLDAACASSLYAIKLACDELQARRADVAVAGAVNAADNLILHQGFAALGALSPTGRSRPLVEGADGLVPSEGAGAIVLKRLADVAPGERVHGVIRAIGLSNDGRRKGLLAPAGEGQAEAMARAYAQCGLDPARDIGLLEAHATGTPVGDGVELRAADTLFGVGRTAPLPVGSAKSNFGHLITVAGLAGLMKLTGAMRHGVLPPTRLDGAPAAAFDGLCLAPQTELQPWETDGPRRAALSTFGFGGNNAHLVLEEHVPAAPASVRAVYKPRRGEIVACGLGAQAGPDRGLTAIVRRLMRGRGEPAGPAETVSCDVRTARTPPADLARAEAQQIAVMDTVEEALAGVHLPETDRIGVYVGMRCAPNAARWMLRARLAQRFGLDPEGNAAARLREDVAEPLQAADVLGAMPNMPANRLTHAHDWRGQGFTLAAEADSGEAALHVAISALEAGEIDLAIVAAADFAAEPVERAARAGLGVDSTPGDACAALVLTRAETAKAAGNRAYGPVSVPAVTAVTPFRDTPDDAVTRLYGDAPAATGLLRTALDLALGARGLARTDTGIAPAIRSARPPRQRLHPAPDPVRPAPLMAIYTAEARAGLSANIRADERALGGRVRLAIVARSNEQLSALRGRAVETLEAGRTPEGEGIYYGEGDSSGALAFVFTGSATTYPQMARGLFAAFPELCPAMAERFPEAEVLAPLLARPALTPFQELCCAVLVSQAQAMLALDWLKLKPHASLGLSLGETNQLIAFGCWRDPAKLLDEIAIGEMYERHLGGTFEVARKAWGGDAAQFQTWQIAAPVESVRTAVAGLAHTDITIIYSPRDCLIGGPGDECAKAIAALGKQNAHRVRHDLFVHTRALAPYGDTWRRYHTRRTHPPAGGVRLYSNAFNDSYTPNIETAAEALTRQAVNPIDFPRTVEAAYRDGVRTFLEIGPRGLLAKSISRILGDRPHRATSLDRLARSDIEQVAHACAELFAAGHAIEIGRLAKRLEAISAHPWPKKDAPAAPVTVPAHPEPPAPILPCRTRPNMSRIPLPAAPGLPALNYPIRVRAAQAPAAPASQPKSSPSQPVEARAPACPGAPSALARREPTGPRYDRDALEAATHGPVSALFGEAFERQDSYRRQVRLPCPPLLLVDEISGIDAEPGEAGKGTIWTSTEVRADEWYLHRGLMRPGPLIEAGQADLSLISYMGADFLNRGERVYRLLGCELTIQEGPLPRPGERLDFQINITGHSELGGVRLFFFEYDCRIGERLLHSVRSGQAGFFTDAELAASKGVTWNADRSRPPTADPAPFDRGRASSRRSFTGPQLEALRAGDALACFGDGFEWAGPHSATPDLPGGKLSLIDDVPEFDPHGGPWKRGYLKARQHVSREAWFYHGHFHNDPCMPGTLMAEAAVQALELAGLAMGIGLERDGFVFEPVPGETARFFCRGQVVPDRDREIVYEVFIDEIRDGESPEIHGALLASCDGLKVFYCPRFGVRLRRHWPDLGAVRPRLIGPERESRGDETAMMACSHGAPSQAFGEMYARFDRAGHVPRLPQPPYHMISRMVSVSTRPNTKVRGAEAVAEFDIDPKAWYFADSANGVMPYAVLVEVLLQPCGWLASHCGFALDGGEAFRNLDGDGEVLAEVRPDMGRLVTRTRLTQFSKVGPMTIVSFEVECQSTDGTAVMTLATSFGFFPRASLEKQAGLKGDSVLAELHARPAEEALNDRGRAPLPRRRLAMIDRVDLFLPDGGAAGLGAARGRQSVDPRAWFFKAHFFQDPVQPGSLGIDAMMQLVMRIARLKRLDDGFKTPRFVVQPAGVQLKWRFRGQVTPDKDDVTTLAELTDIAREPGRVRLIARGALWCDGLAIYDASGLAVEIVEADGSVGAEGE